MSEQYTPMIERISEAFDEIDSDLMLELTAADQEYSDVKHIYQLDFFKYHLYQLLQI